MTHATARRCFSRIHGITARIPSPRPGICRRACSPDAGQGDTSFRRRNRPPRRSGWVRSRWRKRRSDRFASIWTRRTWSHGQGSTDPQDRRSSDVALLSMLAGSAGGPLAAGGGSGFLGQEILSRRKLAGVAGDCAVRTWRLRGFGPSRMSRRVVERLQSQGNRRTESDAVARAGRRRREQRTPHICRRWGGCAPACDECVRCGRSVLLRGRLVVPRRPD